MTKNSSIKEQEILKEGYISHCEVLLGAGRGHLGIINFLRKSGVSTEEIGPLSVEVFEKANDRLYKSQLPLRVIVWSLIAIGVLVPIAFYMTGDGIPVVTIVPVFIGMVLRTKVLRPKMLTKLPEFSGKQRSVEKEEEREENG